MQIINLKDPESYRDIRGFTYKLRNFEDALKIEKLLLATQLRVEIHSDPKHSLTEDAFSAYLAPTIFCFKYPERWLVGICNANTGGAPTGFTISLKTDTQRMLEFALRKH